MASDGKACGIGLLVHTSVSELKPETTDGSWWHYVQRIFGKDSAWPFATEKKNGNSLIIEFVFSSNWEDVSGQSKLKHLIERLDYAIHFKHLPARELINNYLEEKHLSPSILNMLIEK